jgi:hypothetical protein
MLSSNITELSGDLFYGCSLLSGFVVPDSVMDLGDGAIKFDRMAESDAEGHTVRIVSGTSSNGHAYKVLYNGDRLLRFSFVDSDGNEDDITDGKLSESDFATILNGVTGVGKYAFNSVNCIYAHYGSEFTLNIPSTVTYIGMSAFSFHKVMGHSPDYFTEIHFEDRSTPITMGARAFNGSGECEYSITNVPTVIADSTCSANDRIFHDVTSVTFSDSAESIPDYFIASGSFDSLEIPASVRSIGDMAFSFTCRDLATVTFSGDSQLETVGSYSFYYCTALTTFGSTEGVITMPSGVTEIGANAFYNCTSVTDVVLNEGLEEIGAAAFYNTAVTSMTIPATVTSIGTSESGATEKTVLGAFESCTSLASVQFSAADGGASSLALLGSRTFKNCTGLTGVTMAACPSVIGEEAFYRCSSLAELSCPAGDGTGSVGAKAFVGCTALTSLFSSESGTFDLSGLSSLGESAFSGCNMEKVILSDGLAEIPDGCFSGCTGLKEAEFSDAGNLTRIGDSAFRGSGLTSVAVPEGVTEIGASAFGSCASLASVHAPASLVTWESDGGILPGCGSLETLVFAGGSHFAVPYGDGLTGGSSGPDWNEVSSFPRPETIASGTSPLFGSSADSAIALKELAVPYTYLGGLALSGCSNLEKLTLVSSADPRDMDCRQFGFSGAEGAEIADEAGCSAVANLIAYEEWKGMSAYKTGDMFTNIGGLILDIDGFEHVPGTNVYERELVEDASYTFGDVVPSDETVTAVDENHPGWVYVGADGRSIVVTAIPEAYDFEVSVGDARYVVRMTVAVWQLEDSTLMEGGSETLDALEGEADHTLTADVAEGLPPGMAVTVSGLTVSVSGAVVGTYHLTVASEGATRQAVLTVFSPSLPDWMDEISKTEYRGVLVTGGSYDFPDLMGGTEISVSGPSWAAASGGTGLQMHPDQRGRYTIVVTCDVAELTLHLEVRDLVNGRYVIPDGGDLEVPGLVPQGHGITDIAGPRFALISGDGISIRGADSGTWVITYWCDGAHAQIDLRVVGFGIGDVIYTHPGEHIEIPEITDGAIDIEGPEWVAPDGPGTGMVIDVGDTTGTYAVTLASEGITKSVRIVVTDEPIFSDDFGGFLLLAVLIAILVSITVYASVRDYKKRQH